MNEYLDHSERVLHTRRLSLIEGEHPNDSSRLVKKISFSNLLDIPEGKENLYSNGKNSEEGSNARDNPEIIWRNGEDQEYPRKDNKSTASSVFNINRFLKELHEPVNQKLRKCFIIFWSIGWQALLIILYRYLNAGLLFPTDPNLAQLIINVLVFFGKIAGIYFAHQSVTLSLSLYFAMQLTSPNGYSVAPCIYLRQHTLKKMEMVRSLSLNSPCRAALQHVTRLYMFLDLMNVMALLVNIGIYTDSMRSQGSFVNCLVYDPNPSLINRDFPTVAYAMGVAQSSFSSSIGSMRADMAAGTLGNSSTFIMIPSLIDAAQDHQIIIGEGHSMNISTSCICVSTGDFPTFNMFTNLNSSIYSSMTTLLQTMFPSQGMINFISTVGANVQVSTVLSGFNICSNGVAIVPLCSTEISNYNISIIDVEIITDGTSASIAPITATINSYIAPGNISNIQYALGSLMEGYLSSSLLPKQGSGKINPLLKWATTDLQQISLSRISYGMEVLVSYLIRVGIQRTFRPKGEKCPTTLLSSLQTTMYLSSTSMIIGYVMSVVLITLGVLQFYVLGLWLRRSDPVYPALRLFTEKQYFVAMINSSAAIEDVDDLCNAENYKIWQASDKKLRMGEDLGTVDDPEMGTITLGKPKLIRPFQNGRNYQ
ncbi:hypothetical protein HDV01_004240 [Terramyces sp. JEL0728]|nr:hypothetical protein HDV01_004240 [Terramyces sp. JEL0728]